jgi:hypothetical protein
MKKQLTEILIKEFNLSEHQARSIVDRVLIFIKRDRSRKGEMILPVRELEQAMLAVREYKENLEKYVTHSSHVDTLDIVKVQDMRNLEFRLQEYIFANKE